MHGAYLTRSQFLKLPIMALVRVCLVACMASFDLVSSADCIHERIIHSHQCPEHTLASFDTDSLPSGCIACIHQINSSTRTISTILGVSLGVEVVCCQPWCDYRSPLLDHPSSHFSKTKWRLKDIQGRAYCDFPSDEHADGADATCIE